MKNVYKQILLLIILCLGHCINAQTVPCASDQAQVIIEFKVDGFPEENAWYIVDLNEDTLYRKIFNQELPIANNEILRDTVCVPQSTCLNFIVTDAFNDGICCEYGDGYYKVYYDGTIIINSDGDFANEEITSFACELGQTCGSAIDLTEIGSYATNFYENWYLFTPSVSGEYYISTCNINNCDTKIWMYDYCVGLEYDDGPSGAINYATQGCEEKEPLAEMYALLIKDQRYFIRIKDMTGVCVPVRWSIDFLGGSSGCLDPVACNFDPDAQISDPTSCLYEGENGCPSGPDLIVYEEELSNSLFVQKIETIDPCFIEEQCLAGYGTREILRFTTKLGNVGDKDFYLGAPPSQDNIDENPEWEWDPCHNHPHYENYTEYVLYDADYNELPMGFKNGFCVMDFDCSGTDATPKYSCANQGITAGCTDIYDRSLDCQWIDITDLGEGLYTLVVRINWERRPDALGNRELNYNNNWAKVCLDLRRDGLGDAFILRVDPCEELIDCTGEIFGMAEKDCKGECNGPAIKGDIVEDLTLNQSDVDFYINESLKDENESTNCNDLNSDGKISVLDAALLQHCVDSNDPLNGEFCDFPFLLQNNLDTIFLALDNVNYDEKYVDVNLFNPKSDIAAIEISLSGIDISNAELLINNVDSSNYNIYFRNEKVVCLFNNGNVITKQNEVVPFLRVYYGFTTGNEICLTKVTEALNSQRANVHIEPSKECLSSFTSVANFNPKNEISVFPNPFSEQTTFYFNENAEAKTGNLSIYNLQGKLISTYKIENAKSFQFQRRNLESGIYFYHISFKNSRNRLIGKLMVF